MIREFERPIISADEIREESETLADSIKSFMHYVKSGNQEKAILEAAEFYAKEIIEQADETHRTSAKVLTIAQNLANELRSLNGSNKKDISTR